MTDAEYWTKVGKHFGYPKCCIDSFVKRANEIRLTGTVVPITNAQSKVHVNGFIPCDKHANEILEGKIVIKDLIKDRLCVHEFPDDEMDLGGMSAIDAIKKAP